MKMKSFQRSGTLKEPLYKNKILIHDNGVIPKSIGLGWRFLIERRTLWKQLKSISDVTYLMTEK